jgi:hypothetical protein
MREPTHRGDVELVVAPGMLGAAVLRLGHNAKIPLQSFLCNLFFVIR